MRPSTRLACALLLLAPALAFAQSVDREQPQPPGPATDRFSIRGSYFRPGLETIVRLDASPLEPGTVINAEDDLGLDDQADLWRVELYFRFGERNRVRVDYLKLNRFGAVVLQRDLDFGDETFIAGENIESVMDFRSLAFTYTYSLFRGASWELGAGIGLHLMELEAQGEAVDRQDREEESAVAPYPSVAIDGSWRFADRWSVAARAQSLSGSYSDYDGSFLEYHLDVQYRWKRNLAVGIGYTSFEVDVDVNADDFSGLFNLKAAGPELFFRASF